MSTPTTTEDATAAPATTAPATTTYDYDYVVIGGGSGGVSSAKRAATLHNKKVAIVEGGRWGGTCVNVGCVPKKIMFQAAGVRETLLEASHHYKFGNPSAAAGGVDHKNDHKIDWKAMKDTRDAYIVRLNNIYRNGLVNSGVTVLEGWGSLVDAHTIQVKTSQGESSTITADKILIATGGKPMVPTDTPGIEHTITSDGFFELETQPAKVVVVGAGYIAVELAGVLNALGSETHLVVRKHKALREFDDDVSNFLDVEMVKQGIVIHRNTDGVAKIELDPATGKKKVFTVKGDIVIDDVDVVLMAPGRVPNVQDLNLGLHAEALPDVIPNTEGLNLPVVGVKQSPRNFVVVDDYQNTSVDNIFAVGDVTGRVELTPMAIAAGRRLADRLFGGFEHAMDKTSYEFVPTVVFSHPTIGTCGLTQKQAEAKYGTDNLKVYTTTFVNLFYSVYDMEPSQKPKTYAKLICAGVEEKVVGLHMIGMGADEIMQGFGVAIKMGATKADFDSCVAIHPTAGEELVTMGVWGTSPPYSGAKVSPVMGAPAGEPTLTSKM